MQRLAGAGRRARVVALQGGAALQPWHALFDRAGLDGKRDLLLLWNGQRMEAQGWGLVPDVINAALRQERELIAARPGDAIVAALDRLARAADPDRPVSAAPP